MFRLFRKKRKGKPFPKRWYPFLSALQEKWEQAGATVTTYKFKSMGEANVRFPSSTTKNEVNIGLLYWEEEDTDILFLTRHHISFSYPLQKHVDELTEKELEGFLPPTTSCKQCGCFSTWININDLCFDCEKMESKTTLIPPKLVNRGTGQKE